MASSAYDDSEEKSKAVPIKRKQTGTQCAVAECSLRHSDGASLYSFPKDTGYKRQWINFVQTCRANFVPTSNSKICSKHFKSECYPDTYSVQESLGFAVKRRILLPTAVPTIQKHELSKPTTIAGKKLKKRSSTSSAISTLSTPFCSTSNVVTSVTNTTTSSVVSLSSTKLKTTDSVRAPLMCVVETAKKELNVTNLRGAYAKREHMRTVNEALNAFELSKNTEAMETTDNIEMALPQESFEVSVEPPAEQTLEMFIVYFYDILLKVTLEESQTVKKKNKRIMVYPYVSHKGVQAAVILTRNQGTQCNLYLDPSFQKKPETCKMQEEIFVEESTIEENVFLDDPHDLDFQPHADEDAEYRGEIDCSISSQSLESDEKKFIVYQTQLMQLFKNCSRCGKPTFSKIKQTVGSLVRVEQDCPFCHHHNVWNSQPYIKDIPAGNLLMSAAILFSGSLPSKTLLFMKFMGLTAISTATFFDHQRAFLHPAIEDVWNRFQEEYVELKKKQNKPLVLGGDGRSDSPGHCAKYGTYTLMDLTASRVVDVRTVQSNEVGNSALMEKAGFLQSLQFIDDNHLKIGEFVSDRHPQIVKYMREKRQSTKHSIDVWHVAKGLKKKLIALSKEKECEMLSQWLKSILNHLYWIPVYAADVADGEVKIAMWTSLENHLHNIHEHAGTKFPACLHPLLSGRESQKMWLKPGSKLSVKLEDILESRQLMKDIPMLSTGPQTALIESFHALINHFAPKMIGFHYEGIAHRVVLAALHFNENANRQQATTSAGRKCYKLCFKKCKKEFTLQEMKVDCTYDYVRNLMETVCRLASKFSKKEMEARVMQSAKGHLPLCSEFERPSLEKAIENVHTRYASQKTSDT